MVYDLMTKKFRKLDTSNFNDDLTIGLIFLKKGALKILKQTYLICGYVLINKISKNYIPIDFRDDGVTLFEGTYNCMSKDIQKQLEDYIIDIKPYPMFTRFFIEWQFECDYNCFFNNGSLIKLSGSCLNDYELIDRLLKFDCHLICPETYDDLCDITCRLKKVFEFTIYDKDYDDSFKYIVDGLLNRYYIRFNDLEIIQIFYNLCTICDEIVR